MTEEYKQTLIDEVLGTIRRDSNVSPEYVSQLEAYALELESKLYTWRVLAVTEISALITMLGLLLFVAGRM